MKSARCYLTFQVLPDGFSGRIIPKSFKEAKRFPLGKNQYPDLTLAMDCLQSIDYSMNNAIPTHPPQCSLIQVQGLKAKLSAA